MIFLIFSFYLLRKNNFMLFIYTQKYIKRKNIKHLIQNKYNRLSDGFPPLLFNEANPTYVYFSI